MEPTTEMGKPQEDRDDGYQELLELLQRNFTDVMSMQDIPLFKANVADLYDQFFLASLPEEARQHYNCSACRQFMNTYGDLVFIDPKTGNVFSAIWPEIVPEFFQTAINAIRNKVSKTTILSVFYSAKRQWGHDELGGFNHLCIKMHQPIYTNRLKTADQGMAEMLENWKMVKRNLGEFGPEVANTAVELLKSDTLYRSDKILGNADWFLALHAAVGSLKDYRKQEAITWLFVATAPVGWCNIKGNIIGSLYEDIKAGLEYDDIKRRFEAKLDPTVYQRPQVAPTAGNVKQAEEIVEKLGIANSLKRRFARLDELVCIWWSKWTIFYEPSEPEAKKGGVFDDIKTKEEVEKPKGLSKLDIPATSITMAKFRETVLPTAKRIEYYAPLRMDSYTAFMTAVDPDAPPIIQWDNALQRNPFNWFLVRGGLPPNTVNLESNVWHEVLGVSLRPNQWFDLEKFAHQGEGFAFMLEGARVTEDVHSCLFPECLRSDLHPVRATIEAYSKEHMLEGREEGSAVGIMISKETGSYQYLFRVTDEDYHVVKYMIDRWD